MKIRNGFVSNSSSSSFIVATRSEQPTYEEIREALGIVPGSPSEKVFGKLIRFMCDGNRINKVELYESEVLDKLYHEGWNLFKIHASSDDYGTASQFFYENTDIDVDTPKLKIISGY